MGRSTVADLFAAIDAEADPERAAALAAYLQMRPGGYGEGDTSVGVKLSRLRVIARPYQRAGIDVEELVAGLDSPVHEHRHAVLVIMAGRAKRALRDGDDKELDGLFEGYLDRTDRVNNWDLVDCSAPDVVGGRLLDRNRTVLRSLVASPVVWDRRIALVSTHRLIRAGDVAETVDLAARVLDDQHDLVHKAAGWMLREVGARVDPAVLRTFLDAHAGRMPRTMLRFAIEHLPPEDRRAYLAVRRQRRQ
jgi:hypothetical protein